MIRWNERRKFVRMTSLPIGTLNWTHSIFATKSFDKHRMLKSITYDNMQKKLPYIFETDYSFLYFILNVLSNYKPHNIYFIILNSTPILA